MTFIHNTYINISNQMVINMTNCEIESGFQLFARLSTRPTLENIYPILIPYSGPRKREVVEIIGASSTGKTLLVTELLARCLLPNNVYDLELGGKNSGAILINTDHHFSIFKLKQIMEDVIKACDMGNLTSSQVDDILIQSLDNLIILNCFNSEEMYVTLQNLDNILANNDKVSLLVLDSISAYYWSDRTVDGFRKMGSYQKTILKSLQNKTKDYNLVIVFTKPSYFMSKSEILEKCSQAPALEKINYRIYLQKHKSDHKKLLAVVSLPDNTHFERLYEIKNVIEWIIQT